MLFYLILSHLVTNKDYLTVILDPFHIRPVVIETHVAHQQYLHFISTVGTLSRLEITAIRPPAIRPLIGLSVLNHYMVISNRPE